MFVFGWHFGVIGQEHPKSKPGTSGRDSRRCGGLCCFTMPGTHAAHYLYRSSSIAFNFIAAPPLLSLTHTHTQTENTLFTHRSYPHLQPPPPDAPFPPGFTEPPVVPGFLFGVAAAAANFP